MRLFYVFLCAGGLTVENVLGPDYNTSVLNGVASSPHTGQINFASIKFIA